MMPALPKPRRFVVSFVVLFCGLVSGEWLECVSDYGLDYESKCLLGSFKAKTHHEDVVHTANRQAFPRGFFEGTLRDPCNQSWTLGLKTA